MRAETGSPTVPGPSAVAVPGAEPVPDDFAIDISVDRSRSRWSPMRSSIARSAATIVLDGFVGSGTTVIAAERTGRRCCGLELDPAYVDTIVRRWQKLTGGSARHAAS